MKQNYTHSSKKMNWFYKTIFEKVNKQRHEESES